MERLAQLQKEFNVDIENILAPRRAFAREGQVVYVTPEEFMDELFNSFIKRGISNDGAKYAVRKITDSVMGQQNCASPFDSGGQLCCLRNYTGWPYVSDSEHSRHSR